MNIVIVGLGDVAKKAYLPVYAELSDTNVFLVSRDEAKAKQIVAQYRFKGDFRTIEEVPLEEMDAVFIHSATSVHVDQVAYVLNKGKHVFIDKPITFSLVDTKRLVDLAESKGVHFVTGFNRRFAPATNELKRVENPNLVLIQKNRIYKPATIREFIIEDFIHVVDTLRFLTNRQPVEDLSVRTTFEDGELKLLHISFKAGGIEAIGIMNRDNGCTEEVMEVMSPRLKRMSRDVDRVFDLTSEGMLERAQNPWESNLKRRGFTTMINEFMELLNGRDSHSVLAEDSLVTHSICEEILEKAKR